MVLSQKSAARPARPSSLDLDNVLCPDMESVFPDMDMSNNNVDNNNLHPSSAARNSRKKRRRADMPIKKFLGEELLGTFCHCGISNGVFSIKTRDGTFRTAIIISNVLTSKLTFCCWSRFSCQNIILSLTLVKISMFILLSLMQNWDKTSS